MEDGIYSVDHGCLAQKPCIHQYDRLSRQLLGFGHAIQHHFLKRFLLTAVRNEPQPGNGTAEPASCSSN